MFDNIGAKIMKLAKVLCWIGIILSVISGIVIMVGGANVSRVASSYYGYGSSVTGGSAVLVGILTIVLGSLLSWIGSFFTYGFGQLIENTDYIRSNTQHRDTSTFS